MTITKHEIRQGKTAFLVWTAAMGFLLALCVFLFPEMKKQMEQMSAVFSSMGSFTQAFGLDRLNFGTFIGFYALECGNILGLGGAFYASLCAINMLSKEEKDKTAEFLLSHPLSRARIVTEKLLAVLIQVTAMNLILYALVLAAIPLSLETIPFKQLTLIHSAYFIMQIELAGLCFGISSFIRKGSVGIGLGIAALMYFLNLIANISSSAKFLKYITPFGYCDGADIILSGKLDTKLVGIGIAVCLISVLVAYIKYNKKDIY